MRRDTLLLVFLGLGGLGIGLADEPQPATSATNPPVASPAVAPVAAPHATAAAPAVDIREQRLVSLGYKPQMRNGQRLFCKRAPVMGSRVEVVMRCGTVEELVSETQASRDMTDRLQHHEYLPKD